MFEIRMPKFGLSMERGTVTKWYKHPGDAVKKGDALVEIESEKITNDVESAVDGFIKAILVQEGESKAVGEIIGYIAGTEEELREEITLEAPSSHQENNVVKEITKASIAQPRKEVLLVLLLPQRASQRNVALIFQLYREQVQKEELQRKMCLTLPTNKRKLLRRSFSPHLGKKLPKGFQNHTILMFLLQT